MFVRFLHYLNDGKDLTFSSSNLVRRIKFTNFDCKGIYFIQWIVSLGLRCFFK